VHLVLRLSLTLEEARELYDAGRDRGPTHHNEHNANAWFAGWLNKAIEKELRNDTVAGDQDGGVLRSSYVRSADFCGRYG
jgi:hypothetical protein